MTDIYIRYVYGELIKTNEKVYDVQKLSSVDCDNFKLCKNISQFNIQYVIINGFDVTLCFVIKKNIINISDLSDLCFLLCKDFSHFKGLVVYDGTLESRIESNMFITFCQLKEQTQIPEQKIEQYTLNRESLIVGFTQKPVYESPIMEQQIDDNVSTTCDIDHRDINYNLDNNGIISSSMCYVLNKICNIAVHASTGK